MKKSPPAAPRPTRRAPNASRAFTLLEVVLALSIALGLLAVVLHFYQQITRLRDQTLADTTGLAAIRVCMDRFSTELRTALARPGSFRGGPDSLEFLRASIPDLRTLAPASTNGLQARARSTPPPNSPVRRIRYQLTRSADSPDSPDSPATGAASVERTEEPTSELAESSTTSSSSRSEFDELADLLADPTVATTSSGTKVQIPEIHYLALRYWDGTAWRESWEGTDLPRGVEITLATEVSTNTTANTDLVASSAPSAGTPSEIFRRVVALPTAPRPATTPSAFETPEMWP